MSEGGVCPASMSIFLRSPWCSMYHACQYPKHHLLYPLVLALFPLDYPSCAFLTSRLLPSRRRLRRVPPSPSRSEAAHGGPFLSRPQGLAGRKEEIPASNAWRMSIAVQLLLGKASVGRCKPRKDIDGHSRPFHNDNKLHVGEGRRRVPVKKYAMSKIYIYMVTIYSPFSLCAQSPFVENDHVLVRASKYAAMGKTWRECSDSLVYGTNGNSHPNFFIDPRSS